MKLKELSILTNKELKDILKKKKIKNYSKMNKRDLIEKINQITISQNGGEGNEIVDFGTLRRELMRQYTPIQVAPYTPAFATAPPFASAPALPRFDSRPSSYSHSLPIYSADILSTPARPVASPRRRAP